MYYSIFFNFSFLKSFVMRTLIRIRPKHLDPDHQKTLILTWVRMNALIGVSYALPVSLEIRRSGRLQTLR